MLILLYGCDWEATVPGMCEAYGIIEFKNACAATAGRLWGGIGMMGMANLYGKDFFWNSIDCQCRSSVYGRGLEDVTDMVVVLPIVSYGKSIVRRLHVGYLYLCSKVLRFGISLAVPRRTLLSLSEDVRHQGQW